ncbi:MAG: acyl-CoA thioesterase [Puniceicoccales bacterium]|jgi:acyl-CoA thioester hydrolase|nr:acyl-CoA thioesterase [Puniceicoccales bacterium]
MSNDNDSGGYADSGYADDNDNGVENDNADNGGNGGNSNAAAPARSAAPVFTYTRRVAFVECDPAGIVHFSNYARWVEEAECAFWRERGVATLAVKDGRLVGWPKVGFSIRYRSPVRPFDEVAVSLRLERLSSSVLKWRFRIERGETLCANGEMRVVYAGGDPFAGELRLCELPPEIALALGPLSS